MRGFALLTAAALAFGGCSRGAHRAPDADAGPPDSGADTDTGTDSAPDGGATWAPLWSRRGDGLGAAYAIAPFGDGGAAVVGVFQGAIDFGAGEMLSAGANDAFVARFTADGTCLWSARYGGPGGDGANAVAIDAAGRVLVTGSFSGTAQFGDEALVSAGSYDVPLVAFDGAGQVAWVRAFGSAGFDVGYGLAASPSGRIALMGASGGPIDFGGGALEGTESTFVAVFDENAVHVWSRMLDDVIGNGLAISENGEVALAADFSDTIDIGTGPLTSLASTDGLAARFGADGATIFAARVGDGSSMSIYAAAVSPPTSDVVVGGMANAQGVPESSVELDRFSATGEPIWSRKYGVAEYVAANAVAVDTSDEIAVAGFLRNGALDFGCGPLVSPADTDNSFAGDMFLAKMDASGACLWSTLFGGPGNQAAYGVAVDAARRVSVAGEFQTAIDFGLGALIADHYPEPCAAGFAP
jgi:hypothetical protein